MIKIENFEVVGWEHAIRGMRNPMNSWDKLDSEWRNYNEHAMSCVGCKLLKNCEMESKQFIIGPNDLDLMMRLVKAGSVDAKFRRMIVVYVDITAPLYWWKEFDTYKVGTVANSCSTMHKIHAKEFVPSDFSFETLDSEYLNVDALGYTDCPEISPQVLGDLICDMLNNLRTLFLQTKDKRYWYQMIQLLPSSYNQKRTVMLNYEVLANIYHHRRNHKLDEWKEFCKWIEHLPYNLIITGEETKSSQKIQSL